MFFVFPILMLIDYVAFSRNYVIKKNIAENDELLIPDDVSNHSFPVTTEALLFETIENLKTSPNLKLHHFDKNLSDQMLSIKQNIYETGVAYTSARIKNKQNNETSRLEFKQKWSDAINKNQSIDDYDLRHLFSEQNYAVFPDSRLKSAEKKRHCPKCQSSIQVAPEDVDISTARRNSRKCSGCTRTTMFYTLMPYYVPYEPYLNYAPYNFNVGFNKFLQEDFYYDDRPKEDATKNSHPCNESYKSKIEWDTAFLEARPDILVKDILNDLYISYPNAVIRKCYCSTSSSQPRVRNVSNILLSFIFGNMLVIIL